MVLGCWEVAIGDLNLESGRSLIPFFVSLSLSDEVLVLAYWCEGLDIGHEDMICVEEVDINIYDSLLIDSNSFFLFSLKVGSPFIPCHCKSM